MTTFGTKKIALFLVTGAIVLAGCVSTEVETTTEDSTSDTSDEMMVENDAMMEDDGDTAMMEEDEPDFTAEMDVYTIDNTNSSATYTVSKNFFANDEPTIVSATTEGVTGDFGFNLGISSTVAGRLEVDLLGLTSGSTDRDDDLKAKFAEFDVYPTAVFVPRTTTLSISEVQDSEEVAFEVTGDMTIHGVTNTVTLDITATMEGDTITGTGTTTILGSDYDITMPAVGDLYVVEDEIALEVNFVATAE
ncbi:YceI family protein [Candidatus Dojkabacteria bacterium]|uniref:YceI family protein n=1 Tax=Candidatus Dojkabacteria bacterium TaxID=2099670 RepID=A0A955L866_9BACT|nr:YceI family protein [Candidatus Dojkabacteria bacterium]